VMEILLQSGEITLLADIREQRQLLRATREREAAHGRSTDPLGVATPDSVPGRPEHPR